VARRFRLRSLIEPSCPGAPATPTLVNAPRPTRRRGWSLAALGELPGTDPVAVGPGRRAELELGVEAGLPGPRHQREQLGADGADGRPVSLACRCFPGEPVTRVRPAPRDRPAPPGRPPPRGGPAPRDRQAGEVRGCPRPLGAALELAGQREGWLAKGDCVEHRAGRPARLRALLRLDRVPVPLDLLR